MKAEGERGTALSKKAWQKVREVIRVHVGKLTGQLVVLILLSTLISVTFFCVAKVGIEAGLNLYFAKSSYSERKEKDCVRQFQEFVTRNSLTPFNEPDISKWVKGQRVIYLEIYRNNRRLYDSLSMADTNAYEENTAFSNHEGKDYNITFADGAAVVRLFGIFEYQYYVYAMIAEILSGFLVFLTVFIYGVKKGIRYIQKIQSEICVMEGGCLDQSVTISGDNELAQLAQGLEKMRQSLGQAMEEERKLREANQWLVTGIAHDLRTPLTSLTVYVEILQTDICRDDKARKYYLNKIMRKAVLIKELSDRLFESCQVKTDKEVKGMDAPQGLQNIFEDYLSEMTAVLDSQGFEIEAELEWRPDRISVRMDYIARIIDNLSTNLIKYADPKELIWLRTVYEEEWDGIEICNGIKAQAGHVESTKVGLENIKCMMKSMGGACLINENGERFHVKLLFIVRNRGEVI